MIQRLNTIQYGGFWQRLKAVAIDDLIFLPVIVLIHFFRPDDYGLWEWLASIVVLFIYMGFVYVWGATPGKKIIGLKIVNINGDRLSMTSVILRSAPELLYTLGLGVASMITFIDAQYAMNSVFFALAVWLVFDMLSLLRSPQKRSLHDKLAGTMVLVAK